MTWTKLSAITPAVTSTSRRLRSAATTVTVVRPSTEELIAEDGTASTSPEVAASTMVIRTSCPSSPGSHGLSGRTVTGAYGLPPAPAPAAGSW